jgi:hypothetical protein
MLFAHAMDARGDLDALGLAMAQLADDLALWFGAQLMLETVRMWPSGRADL